MSNNKRAPKKLQRYCEQLQRLAALTLGESYPDPDDVNAKFHSPFAGMKEMYALQKGIEAGCEAENARLLPLIKALVEDREALRAALKPKCMCYDENDERFFRNPCHSCRELENSDARLAALGAKGEWE